MQRYLDEANEMTQRWVEFHQGIPETPPLLEGSRILLLMISAPRCLFAALYALYLTYQLNAELYVLHKGFIAPFIVEQANELQVSIPFARKVDYVGMEALKNLVSKYYINLIVISSGIPNARELLTLLDTPVLFIKGASDPNKNTNGTG